MSESHNEAMTRARQERRERIAVEAMHGLLSCVMQMATQHRGFEAIATMSVSYADALIARLDEEEAKP